MNFSTSSSFSFSASFCRSDDNDDSDDDDWSASRDVPSLDRSTAAEPETFDGNRNANASVVGVGFAVGLEVGLGVETWFGGGKRRVARMGLGVNA